MDKQTPSTRIARRILKTVLIPAIIVIGLTRFIVAPSYWLDWLTLSLLALVAVLFFFSGAFTREISNDKADRADYE
jgi:hypothetical protein